MARCIDADKAKEEIKSSFYIDSVIFGELMSFRDGKIGVDNLIHDINVQAVEEAVNTLENVETEDVAPILHAHWERHFKRPGVYEDLWLYCTNCNSRTSEEYAPYWWSYCPYCGAKMDEEVEDG